ncbi:hypothetical protein OAQ84_00785 [Bdellovibrionales bacterium]|nr:hypothetical protein [Bdellovibrionales bacterium]
MLTFFKIKMTFIALVLLPLLTVSTAYATRDSSPILIEEVTSDQLDPLVAGLFIQCLEEHSCYLDPDNLNFKELVNQLNNSQWIELFRLFSKKAYDLEIEKIEYVNSLPSFRSRSQQERAESYSLLERKFQHAKKLLFAIVETKDSRDLCQLFRPWFDQEANMALSLGPEHIKDRHKQELLSALSLTYGENLLLQEKQESLTNGKIDTSVPSLTDLANKLPEKRWYAAFRFYSSKLNYEEERLREISGKMGFIRDFFERSTFLKQRNIVDKYLRAGSTLQDQARDWDIPQICAVLSRYMDDLRTLHKKNLQGESKITRVQGVIKNLVASSFGKIEYREW